MRDSETVLKIGILIWKLILWYRSVCAHKQSCQSLCCSFSGVVNNPCSEILCKFERTILWFTAIIK